MNIHTPKRTDPKPQYIHIPEGPSATEPGYQIGEAVTGTAVTRKTVGWSRRFADAYERIFGKK
jgi:hypothetical protein